MKNRGLLITTIIFFLLVNTNYYWEGKLGLFAFPFFLLLAAIYLGLAVALLRQLYFLIKEKFKRKNRFFLIGLLTAVLLLTYFRPLGLVDFDKLEGNDVLVAEREGSANCLTTLKLKDDFTFRERIGCFGVSEIKGTFRVVKDTIYFDNIQLGRGENDFYKFAVIKPSKFDNSKILGDLIRYKNSADTVGHELWITKNELQKLNDKSRTANREFAAMLADEYILSFISLSAHIQPTEFYQLLLLSSSSVFQSAAALGWTLKIPAQQQALAVVCYAITKFVIEL